MSGIVAATVICDGCGMRLVTNRTTMRGARGDAERKGWRVSHMAGGRHPDASNDPKLRDECPDCRLDELADCAKLFAEAMSQMKEASDSVVRKSVKGLPREWTDIDFEDPDHIWLSAFKCIRPTDEFAAEVGRSIIASAMQAHPKRVALTVNAS